MPQTDKKAAMNRKTNQSEKRGLLANGSSGRWDIAVDELVDRQAWSLEIDGPQTYLVFQLQDLKVIPKALGFLKSGLRSNAVRDSRRGHNGESTLNLGHFGSALVSLMWDNEDFPRCFIIIGPKAQSTLRLSLDAEDIEMLIEALGQVVEDLPSR